MTLWIALKKVALLAVVVVLAGACSQVRGERVESGFGSSTDLAPASDDLAFAAAKSDVVQVSADTVTAEPFDFTATTLDGQPVAGLDLYERRPLVVVFNVPSCVICLSEAPFLAEVAERSPEVTFVVTHSGGSAADYEDFLSATALDSAPVVHIDDSDRFLWNRFGIVAQPSTILVDAEGRITMSTGALETHGFDRAVELVSS